MEDIQITVCPQCGSTNTGALFCKNCGATLRAVFHSLHPQGRTLKKGDGFWSFSKRDVGWIVFGYVGCFLSFRFDNFDMLGHNHRWFQHPMPTATAAWVAIVPAVAWAVLYKIRFGDELRHGSYHSGNIELSHDAENSAFITVDVSRPVIGN